MKQSTIFLTRTGFLFQDKVAIYLFLRHFHQRDLEEFYIDYPLEVNQKSLDVRLITKDRVEKVYEIKSGNTFKEVEDEILDAVLDLYKYFIKNKKSRQHLLISHGFKPAISHIWDILVTLQKYKILNSDRSKEITKELFDKLNSREAMFADFKSVHTFILSLVLDDPFSDQNTGNSENNPYIEKFILQEINELLRGLRADSRESEYPSEILFYDLIYLCGSNAGGNENLLPIFTKSFLNHLTMRRLFSKHYERPADLEQKREDLEREVENDFYEWWNPGLIQKGNQSATKS